MNNIEFSKNLIKGKIAEIIFEQMFRESDQYTILHGGYEYTSPELAQYQHKLKQPGVLDGVRHSPDFTLIKTDKKTNKTEVYFVEIKYMRSLDKQRIKKIADELVRERRSPWLFVASLEGFFFEPCHDIINKNGDIGPLYEKWATAEVQKQYLGLLKEFEK